MPGKETEVTTIPQIRQVFYDLYANFPAANTVNVGDLAYATDRRCFYRSSGANWDEITVYSLAGLAADIPAAATLPNGSIYFATDTLILYIKQGAAWLPMASRPLTVAETEVYNAAAPVAWTDLDLSAVVGANPALVILKVTAAGGGINTMAVRRNGDTDDLHATDNSTGASAARPWTQFVVLLVVTDAAGIIEHIASANNNIIIDIIGFMV